MPERIPLSKKLRFDIFKRDAFTCQYCGNTPPQVILEIDHIIPVSKKGTNQIDNLITSCFECNRGKSNFELSILPKTTIEKKELLIEKETQYKEYQKLLIKVDKRIRQDIQLIDDTFQRHFPDRETTKSFKHSSIRKFIEKLGFIEVNNAMEAACSKMIDSGQALKYFCGICWTIIKRKNNNE